MMASRTKKRSKKADRLSNLPDEIISNILSLMPTKFAVRTCILSKRWRHSWVFTNNVDLDDRRSGRHGKVCLSDFVDHVLSMKIEKTFKVELFRLDISKWSFPKPILLMWISDAIKLNVSELDIKLIKPDLPLSLFTCKTLTKFTLHFCRQSMPLWDWPSHVNLPCLKTLDIMVYSKPFQSAFKLINGCPILENLSLEIKERIAEQDYYFEIPTLKRLTLLICTSIWGVNKVVLNVPNLECLYVKEQSLKSLYVMKDLSSLIEVKISCGPSNDLLWDELLKGVSGAQYLSLNIKYHYDFSYPNLPLPKFSNVKRLELSGCFDRIPQLIPQILESCSELEHLCIKTKLQGDYWKTEPQSIPGCMLTNLKTIQLTTKGNECDIELLKYMMENSMVLKKLTVKFDASLPLNKEGAFSQDVSTLPKASKGCQIHFVGKWPHSTTSWCFSE